MISSSIKDGFHSPFPPIQSLVFLRPLMSHTHTHAKLQRGRQPHQAQHHEKAATTSSKPSFLLHRKLAQKFCKSAARAEGELLSLALAGEGMHLPPGHWDGVRTVPCTPQGTTGLVFAAPGASCPLSNDISVLLQHCCLSPSP